MMLPIGGGGAAANPPVGMPGMTHAPPPPFGTARGTAPPPPGFGGDRGAAHPPPSGGPRGMTPATPAFGVGRGVPPPSGTNGGAPPLTVKKPDATAGAGGWKMRMTVDGGEYYHNVITDAVSWDKPRELQSAAERETDNSDCVWMPSAVGEGGWVPAHVLSRTAKGIKVRPAGGGKEVTLGGGKKDEPVYPLRMSHLAPRFMMNDLVLLESLDPPLIAYDLRHRFQNDLIYTWVGADQSVLVSLNPFKRLPIYGADALAANAAPAPNTVREPHTYAIASAAYKFLRLEGKDTSILISGESGAGKTEATKQCLNFLADTAGSESGVEQRILSANPILEAFGNAKTLRNNNSSRFGRWMEVHFATSGRHEGQVAGAFIENYLLEKSRLVSQQENERSYHVFYQLCASPWASALTLQSGAEAFRFLAASGCTSVAGIDDASDFDEVVEALTAMGLGQEDVQWVFSLCAAVLHLGNVRFQVTTRAAPANCGLDGYCAHVSCVRACVCSQPVDAGEGSAVDANSTNAVACAAMYLGADAAALNAALVERQVAIRGEVSPTAKPSTPTATATWHSHGLPSPCGRAHMVSAFTLWRRRCSTFATRSRTRWRRQVVLPRRRTQPYLTTLSLGSTRLSAGSAASALACSISSGSRSLRKTRLSSCASTSPTSASSRASTSTPL